MTVRLSSRTFSGSTTSSGQVNIRWLATLTAAILAATGIGFVIGLWLGS